VLEYLPTSSGRFEGVQAPDMSSGQRGLVGIRILRRCSSGKWSKTKNPGRDGSGSRDRVCVAC
jgi:hypothetical protein